MATRMQQRRGTAAQWISTNGGAGPVLNAGEMGWESDTNKFKIGDGVNNWTSLDYFSDINSTVNPAFGSSITFEGATANDFETTLAITDPTADRTITFPDATGTVALTSDIAVTASSTTTFSNKSISLGSNTVTSTLAQLNTAISDADVASLAGAETLTNKTLTSPVITGAVFNDGSIVFEGATADDYETTLTVTDPTADRTITFPNETGTVQLRVTDVSDTEIGYLNGVTSAIQTQMDAKAPLAAPALTGDATAVNLTISGNLTVNGTTTNINSTNLVIEDKNIILADVETPTDTTADGGGITLKGATDKTFNWVDATDSWTSSEHLFLSATKELRLADTDSSHYVGFKSPATVTSNKIWTLPSEDGTANQVLKTDGSGTLSWATAGGGGAAFSELMLIGA
jgi:hypothetical protein